MAYETKDEVLTAVSKRIDSIYDGIGGLPDSITVDVKNGFLKDETSWETLAKRGITMKNYLRDKAVTGLKEGVAFNGV